MGLAQTFSNSCSGKSSPLNFKLTSLHYKILNNTPSDQQLVVLGAEKVLDELLAQGTQIGKWIYKKKHDHQLVSAVCIQIKGDIQYNLGQWTEGAKLLLESLILFRYAWIYLSEKNFIATCIIIIVVAVIK